jgi:hypothetical protein
MRQDWALSLFRAEYTRGEKLHGLFVYHSIAVPTSGMAIRTRVRRRRSGRQHWSVAVGLLQYTKFRRVLFICETVLQRFPLQPVTGNTKAGGAADLHGYDWGRQSQD